MNRAVSPFSKSAVILAIVALAAAILNLVFGRTLHIEPLGMLGFGLFCIVFGVVIAAVSRRDDPQATSVVPDTHPASTPPRPMIVREKGARYLQPSEAAPKPCHALTIDLEDYFHTEVASQGISFAEWEQQPSRIEASTHRLLELLEKNQTRATFFVLGWVARRYPRLIEEVHERGHEIGCHSLDHRLVCRMKPEEFLDTTRTAKELIEAIIREPVLGYRAPCFSITPGCEWAFDALAQLGFAYDSSVHPVNHPLYGNPKAPRTAYPVANGRLMELPIATWKVGGRNLSVGGGAYLRLLPYQYIHRGLAAWEKQMNSPAMLYLHPWELDPYQPYIPLSFQSKIRQTWGTATMEEKLQNLLTRFQFAPVREVHRNLLDSLGRQPLKIAYRQKTASEQVAG